MSRSSSRSRPLAATFSPDRRRTLALLASIPLTIGRIARASAQATPVKVGIISGEEEDIWRIVAKNAQNDGLSIQPVAFSEGGLINASLASGDIDANAFQHEPFLRAQNAAFGYDIVPVGNTYFAPIGIYSQKWKTLSELPHRALIGVPADPTNEGRALTLLQSLGVIGISSEAGSLPTALDISENPRSIIIKELDDPVLARSLSDLDAGVVITEWAYKAGIDLQREQVARESLDHSPYVNFIAVDARNAQASWVPILVKAFHQPNIRQALLDSYHGAIVPAWT